MPQFDFFAFFVQTFWIIVFFVGFYLFTVKQILPRIAEVIKMRRKLAEKKELQKKLAEKYGKNPSKNFIYNSVAKYW